MAHERRRRRGLTSGPVAVGLVVVASLILLVLQGCAATSPAPTLPPSPIEGVVVSVDAASLSDVHGFRLRTKDGAVYRLKLGTLQNATEFSPSHLAEHQATSSPIRAWYLLDGATPVVYRLEDAAP
jgi:hypothetical protein